MKNASQPGFGAAVYPRLLISPLVERPRVEAEQSVQKDKNNFLDFCGS